MTSLIFLQVFYFRRGYGQELFPLKNQLAWNSLWKNINWSSQRIDIFQNSEPFCLLKYKFIHPRNFSVRVLTKVGYDFIINGTYFIINCRNNYQALGCISIHPWLKVSSLGHENTKILVGNASPLIGLL